jgi:hypothetical protein
MTLNRSFWAGVGCSFLGLLLAAEISLRITVPSGFWYRHFDLSGDMTSLAELRDRSRYAVPPERKVVLLGDSVLGASALCEHRLPDARSKTLARALGASLEPLGYRALNLGSDGLLLPDIQALATQVASEPRQKILLLLNFRMFAKDFGQGPTALSRRFLLGSLPPDIQKRSASSGQVAEETRLGDLLYDGMAEHWFLFREAQAFKTLWYYPSQKDFFQRTLEGIVGVNEAQTDMVEAALKQKVASYYQAYDWEKTALPFTCLKDILDGWAQRGVDVTVVLTPQNPSFLGPYLDKPSFERNRRNLAAFMRPYGTKGIRYRDWSARYPAALFFDHCHLKPEGNLRYATDLQTLLTGKGKP